MDKIDKESAELEFLNFCKMWEIDSDIEDMNEDDRDSFNLQKSKIIRSIQRGRLVVKEDNEALDYTFAKPDVSGVETLEIRRPKGAALISMDRYKEGQGVHKTYSVLGYMTGKDTSFFSRIDGIDLKIFMAIVTLFLAS